MLSKAYLVAALVLTLSSAMPALAKAPATTSPIVEAAMKVDYSDLDVDTMAGAITLLARIRSAAYTVCSADFDNRAVRNLCMRESTERALAQIDRPLPVALYRGDISARVGPNK